MLIILLHIISFSFLFSHFLFLHQTNEEAKKLMKDLVFCHNMNDKAENKFKNWGIKKPTKNFLK